MSPPEVWGPAVWILFHTLIEKMNPHVYPHVIGSMFGMIVRICKFLPCPECSIDASNFLAKIKLNDYKTKNEFKNMLYLFHNWVNAKKRKPLYNYSHLQKYDEFNLILVINNFIAKYNTKGNMKLLAESFQRTFVVKELVSWFKIYARAFIQPTIINYPKQAIEEQTTNEAEQTTNEAEQTTNEAEQTTNEEEQTTNEEEQTTNEEEQTTNEEEQTTNEEEQTTNEEEQTTNEEEQPREAIIIIDENHSDKNITSEEIDVEFQEEVVIEQPVIIQQPKKKRNGKLRKK
jgi:flagellar biosynthesis GTPase FlhF